MPLPTSAPSAAGTTTVINNVPGTSGYTGSYTFIDPGGNYPQAALEAQVNKTAGGIGSNNLQKPKKGSGFGVNLPDFSGLDRALGALGAAIAIGQTIMSIPSIVMGTINNFKAIGNNLYRTLEGVLSIPSQLGQSAKNAFNPEYYTFSDKNNQDWRVRINTNFTILSGGALNHPFELLKKTNGMVFPLTPNITVTHKASYTTVEPVHNNFAFQGYKSSNVDDITISCDFPVNSYYDGRYWIAATNFLKSATKMFYGQSSPQGNPPIVCQLSGYGAHVFNDIPVVIKSYQVELKDNVQYKMIGATEAMGLSKDMGNFVADKNVTWVPMNSTITVVVSPVYNREKLRQFSLQDYSAGGTKGVL